jgi:hypothetical protein
VVAPPVKRSFVWSLAAVASIGYLCAMVISGALPELRSRVKFEAQGVMTLAPERIDRVEIERGAARVALARTSSGGWSREGGEVLSVPVAAKVSLAVQYMHTAGPVRAMTAEEIRGIAPPSSDWRRRVHRDAVRRAGARACRRVSGRAMPRTSAIHDARRTGRHVPHVALRRPAVGRLDRSVQPR